MAAFDSLTNNYFTDINLIIQEGENDHPLHHDTSDIFVKLLKFIKKTCKLRAKQLTTEIVEYLRIAVRVKRRSSNELSHLSSKYRNDWLLNWLAVRSFGLAAFTTITNEKFKSDREIITAGIEKDGNILFESKISREDLKKDDELILTALKTSSRVLELANDRILNDRSLFESLLKKDGLLLRYCGESIKYDKILIGIALKQNIRACQYVPSELVNEKLVLRGVATDGLLLKYFPDYNSNRNIVISAVKQNGFALEFASNGLKADEHIVQLATQVERDAISFASPILITNNEFMDNFLKTIERGLISSKVQGIIKICSSYEEFMMKRYVSGAQNPDQYSSASISLDNWIHLLAKNSNLYQSFLNYYPSSEKLLKDVNFLLRIYQTMSVDADCKESYSDYLELQKEIILKNPYSLYYFDMRHRSDLDLMFRLIRETKYYPGGLLDKSLLDNREFLLELLKKHSYYWENITTFDDELFECGVIESSYYFGKYLDKYCNNTGYIIRAIKRNPYLFQYLSHKLDETDRKQVEMDIPKPSTTDRIDKLSAEEKKDKELIINHLKFSPMSFPFIDESLKTDKDVIMTAINKHGGVLKLLPPEMKKNQEVVLASKHQGFAYADKTLQRDRQVILNAAKYYGGILEILDEDLRNDREIVIQCIKTTPMSFEFASETLRNDVEIVSMAYDLNPKVLEFTDLGVSELANSDTFFF